MMTGPVMKSLTRWCIDKQHIGNGKLCPAFSKVVHVDAEKNVATGSASVFCLPIGGRGLTAGAEVGAAAGKHLSGDSGMASGAFLPVAAVYLEL